MGVKAYSKKLRRKMFSSIMEFNKKQGNVKGSGVKPSVTPGAFGKNKYIKSK